MRLQTTTRALISFVVLMLSEEEVDCYRLWILMNISIIYQLLKLQTRLGRQKPK